MGFFFDFRNRLATQFHQLFEGGGSASVVVKKWGWYHVFYTLAKEDILKFDEVTNRPVTEVLTFLAYEQDMRSVTKNKY